MVLLLLPAGVVAYAVTAHSESPISRPTQQDLTDYCLVPRSLRVAVVGDYGVCAVSAPHCEAQAAVAHFVREAAPNFVVTTGDNNYVHGEAGNNLYPPPGGSGPAHISNNNEAVYDTAEFPPPGATGFPPSPRQTREVELYRRFLDGRFYPSLGNHDWHQPGAGPAKTYFGVEGEGESLRVGPLELFVVDTNEIARRGYDPDPDVTDPPGLLAQVPGLREAIRQSPSCWKVLYMHHPPYSSSRDPRRGGGHRPDPLLATAIAQVRATPGVAQDIDLVLSGHIHALEWTIVPGDRIQYILNGKGGAGRHKLFPPELSATRLYADDNPDVVGFVMLSETGQGYATPSTLTLEWHAVMRCPPENPTCPQPPYSNWLDKRRC